MNNQRILPFMDGCVWHCWWNLLNLLFVSLFCVESQDDDDDVEEWSVLKKTGKFCVCSQNLLKILNLFLKSVPNKICMEPMEVISVKMSTMTLGINEFCKTYQNIKNHLQILTFHIPQLYSTWPIPCHIHTKSAISMLKLSEWLSIVSLRFLLTIQEHLSTQPSIVCWDEDDDDQKSIFLWIISLTCAKYKNWFFLLFCWVELFIYFREWWKAATNKIRFANAVFFALSFW